MNYRFGPFVFDQQRGTLINRKTQTSTNLRPKVAALLVFLIENRSRVISKQELMAQIWPDTIVSDNTLMQGVQELRKATGDSPSAARYIKTYPRRGYQWVADIAIPAPENPNKSWRKWLIAGVVITAISLLLLVQNQQPKALQMGEKEVWLIHPFQNGTGKTDLDWVRWGLHTQINRHFANLGVTTVPTEEVYHLFHQSSTRERPPANPSLAKFSLEVLITSAEPFQIRFKVFCDGQVTREGELQLTDLRRDIHQLAQGVLQVQAPTQPAEFHQHQLAEIAYEFKKGEAHRASRRLASLEMPADDPTLVTLQAAIAIHLGQWQQARDQLEPFVKRPINNHLEMKASLMLGNLEMQGGNFKKAETLLKTTYQFASEQGMHGEALIAGNFLLDLLFWQGKATETWQQELEKHYLSETGITDKVVQMFYGARDKKHRFDMAPAEQFQFALNYYRDTGHRTNLAMTYLLLGQNPQLPLTQRLKNLEMAYGDFLEIDDRPNQALALNRMAWVSLKLDNPLKAKDCVEKAFEINQTMGAEIPAARDLRILGTTMFCLAQESTNYSSTSRNQAREYLSQALAIFQRCGAITDVMQTALICLIVESKETHITNSVYLKELKNYPSMAFWANLLEIKLGSGSYQSKSADLNALIPQTDEAQYVLMREKARTRLLLKDPAGAQQLLIAWKNKNKIWHISDETCLEFATGQNKVFPEQEPLIQTYIRLN